MIGMSAGLLPNRHLYFVNMLWWRLGDTRLMDDYGAPRWSSFDRLNVPHFNPPAPALSISGSTTRAWSPSSRLYFFLCVRAPHLRLPSTAESLDFLASEKVDFRFPRPSHGASSTEILSFTNKATTFPTSSGSRVGDATSWQERRCESTVRQVFSIAT